MVGGRLQLPAVSRGSFQKEEVWMTGCCQPWEGPGEGRPSGGGAANAKPWGLSDRRQQPSEWLEKPAIGINWSG